MADLSNYLKSQYASTLESELAGLENAYKQSTAMLDRTAQAIPQEYETKRNTVAATNALEKQAFDERANAMGLNTGTSGQAQLARSSMYQRDLAGIGAAEANAMADVELQRSNRQAEYEMAIAQAKAENAAALNSALYAEMVRQQELAAAQAAAAAKVSASTKSSSGGGSGGYVASSYSPTITANKAAESAKGSGTTSFSNVQRTISAALQAGDFNKASNLAYGAWSQATTNQRNDLRTLFERNGYSIDN